MYFPGLITHFCRAANIEETFDQRYLEEPQKELTKKAYNHFCTTHGIPNLPTKRRYRNRGIRGRGAAAQPQQAAGRGVEPPPPVGGYPDVPPPWAEQILRTMGEFRDEKRTMVATLNRVVPEINRRQTQETDKRHSGTYYTGGH